ncbi:MAG: zinc ABC transporter substrate-binding protein [Spirochaetales bacterium]|nr:zinc ABC transporter substrate-binding protein [Spirochaetales bacterium]
MSVNMLNKIRKRAGAPFIIVLFLLFFILPVFSGCTRKKEPEPIDATFTIVTSFYPLYIFSLNITRDVPDIKLLNMTPPYTGCLHDYQLSPKNMLDLEKASVFIINGGGLESFLDKVIEQYPELTVLTASEGIEMRTNDFTTGETNPHVWVSLSLAIREIENIGRGLALADPEHKALYFENTKEYVKKIKDLKERMHNELDSLGGRDIITFHEAFPYFAGEFNLCISAVIEREPGSEPGVKELTELIETINREHVKALFVEPQYPAKIAELLNRETGVPVLTLDPAVTGPELPDAYEKIMLKNMEALKKALK